jgi:hypothetical protein
MAVTSHRRLQGPLAIAGGFLAAAVVLLGWLLSSPPGSSPDDGYHLASIWCSRGYVDEFCLENPGSASPEERALVPFAIRGVSCYAYDPTASAACTLEVLSTSPSQYAASSGGNITGERAPLYYWTMHAFVSTDIPAALARIRLANVTILLIMLAATMAVASGPIRRAVALTWLLASLPLGLFIVTSTNTGAWGLIGLGTFWANAVSMRSAPTRLRRSAAALLAIVGLIMALGSRTEALGHTVVTIAALGVMYAIGRGAQEPFRQRPAALRARRTRLRVLGGVVALATLTLAIAVLPISDYLSGATSELRKGHAELVRRGFGEPLLLLVLEAPQMWTGPFGDKWGLGWIDTPMPSIASLAAMASFLAVLALALKGAQLPKMLAVSTVFMGMLALPVLSLLWAGNIVGEQLQPRMYMALLFVLLGLSLVPEPNGPRLWFGAGQRAVLIASLGIGQATALHTNMRRYVAGLDSSRYLNLNSDIQWWWADVPSPMFVWTVTSITYVALAALILQQFDREAVDDTVLRPASKS